MSTTPTGIDWTGMAAADFDTDAAPAALFDLEPANLPTPEALF